MCQKFTGACRLWALGPVQGDESGANVRHYIRQLDMILLVLVAGASYVNNNTGKPNSILIRVCWMHNWFDIYECTCGSLPVGFEIGWHVLTFARVSE